MSHSLRGPGYTADYDGNPSSSLATQDDYLGISSSSEAATGRHTSLGSEIPGSLLDFLDTLNCTPAHPSASLQEHGSQNSSANLLHAYHRFTLPPVGGRESPPSGTIMLAPGKRAEAYKEFRRFTKTAARCCVRMSSEALSIEDVQAEYITIMESLDGLRDFMLTLPYKEWEWLGPSYVCRLPAPFPPEGIMQGARDPLDALDADTTLVAAEGVSHAAPLPVVFPLRTVTLPPDADVRIVPTSDPHEIEYPLMLELSLESQLEMGMYNKV
ncbi:hypothetical protein OH77DRAFT_1425238 [Trametes cingulata]|nr:hypothetical protein OH77DRAFT_1425238 [Trametes cingulata]